MGNIIMWLPTVLKMLVMIYKLIKELKAQGHTVSACVVAVDEAKASGDMTKLESILADLRKGKCK